MINILVTGGNGQVGSELNFLKANYPNFRLIFTDQDTLDITDEPAVNHMITAKDINYCINCAAYTAVDKAESNAELAERINVEGPKNLAQACLVNQIPLIHFSTDYVYHNDQNTPFKEGDPTSPKGVYAKTKLQGDEVAQQIHLQTMVIRTSWVYSSFGHNFVKTMLRLGNERDNLSVIFDQIGTPTYARDLAKAVLDVIHMVENDEIDSTAIQGVYHYSNEGVTSWYDFAKTIFEINKIDCKVAAIETKDYPTAAERPHFSVLNKHKFKSTFGLEVPHWRESLGECLKAIHQEAKKELA